jgi:hypothetical protein
MTTESPPQKEAAPRSRKAATAKTDALQKSHITSQIQLPKALAKLGITATDPSGRPPLRGMAAKEWRRWKSANLNIVTFVEHDLGNCSLLTITSRRSTEKLFRKRLKNFWDRRLREHVTARITVLELHKNGSPHAHLLLRTLVTANEAILLLARAIAHARSYGLGKCFSRIVDDAVRAANYLAKSLLPGARRVAGRVITYSEGVRRAMTTRCMVISERSRRWGRGVLRLAEALECAPELLAGRLGPQWAWRYRREIYAMGSTAK